MAARWTADDIPDLDGRTILVTGGNSGIGLEAVRLLAQHGARVLLACRDTAKGARAAEDVRAGAPGATVEIVQLDLADLASVEAAADDVHTRTAALDVLVNNAGVMALPYRTTVDGFEMQFGTNHLGHFALTGRLLDLLLASPAPRVVTVASSAHRIGRIDFDNLDGSKGYRKWPAYGMSKLANLLFTFELQRRSEMAGAPLIAAAAHPGWAATNLQTTGPKMSGSKLMEVASNLGNLVVGQSAAMGALPTAYAAVAPDVRGGDYIGPDGFREVRGHPVRVGSAAKARDAATAARLWEVSSELTGVRYDALATAGA